MILSITICNTDVENTVVEELRQSLGLKQHVDLVFLE